VMFADPAVTFEGLAIDDIHIYDLQNPIYPTKDVTIENTLEANIWNSFLALNQLVASIKTSKLTENVTVSLYKQDTIINIGATQYVLPRSYLITSPNDPAATSLRLYLSDSDVARVANSTECPSCPKVRDAYSLGITQYYNHNAPATENGMLWDDTGGGFSFHKPGSITWLPYDKGYVAEVDITHFSECWFNNGGPGGMFDAGTEYLSFLAYKRGNKAKLEWRSLVDTSVENYVIERSEDDATFDSVGTVTAQNLPVANYTYVDAPTFDEMPHRFYRLRWKQNTGKEVYYSPIRRVGTEDGLETQVTFDAAMLNSKGVLLEWTSYLDGLAQQYTLERAIEDQQYTTIARVAATNRSGQHYSYLDKPDKLRSGTTLKYRLTAILQSEEKVVPPVRTVEWIDENVITAIYPNPTSDGKFTIEWNADPGSEMKLQVTVES